MGIDGSIIRGYVLIIPGVVFLDAVHIPLPLTLLSAVVVPDWPEWTTSSTTDDVVSTGTAVH